MTRRVTALGLVIILLPATLFVSKYAWDNHQDDVEAAQLLTKLKAAGLPAGAELKDQGSEVGNWVGSSDLLQMMAYRVFTCPLSQEKVKDFYGTELSKNPSEDFHVVGHDEIDFPTPIEIRTYFKKASKSEQPNTYAIYVLDCPSGGFDIRGW